METKSSSTSETPDLPLVRGPRYQLARLAIAAYPFVMMLGYPGPGPKFAMVIAAIVIFLGSWTQKRMAVVLLLVAAGILVADALLDNALARPMGVGQTFLCPIHRDANRPACPGELTLSYV